MTKKNHLSIDGLSQDFGNSIANTPELLQSSAKSSISWALYQQNLNILQPTEYPKYINKPSKFTGQHALKS